MSTKRNYPIVALNRFIEATRDSGYKNTAAAVAELIDNSLEADATVVDVSIVEFNGDNKRQLKLSVSDNGCGMTPSVLRLALQFGGSTRFNSRNGVGRYGMGLPNSSLSQARRMDVYTRTRGGLVWWSYLDVDEIAAGGTQSVPKPRRKRLKPANDIYKFDSGTVILWSKCDRLNHKKVKTVAAQLHKTLGRTFRKQIQCGKLIRINGDFVQPIDPLFLCAGNNLTGAKSYGPAIDYDVQLPDNSDCCASTVRVIFSELPIEKWHGLPNEEKRAHGISKNAGVSIVRANREIDYGWFFMGAKRKENYDDWWRCEVQFTPELDELFGVTHTKQGVHPTDEIINILAPDLERVAHELNSRVRGKFLEVKSDCVRSDAQVTAENRDYLLEPPHIATRALRSLQRGFDRRTGISDSHSSTLPGLSYRIEHRILRDISFFVPTMSNHELIVLLNEDHPFYEHIYNPVVQSHAPEEKAFRLFIELLILSAARAECGIRNRSEKALASSLRRSWSNVLAAFLT
jgi:hypothetical protein